MKHQTLIFAKNIFVTWIFQQEMKSVNDILDVFTFQQTRQISIKWVMLIFSFINCVSTFCDITWVYFTLNIIATYKNVTKASSILKFILLSIIVPDILTKTLLRGFFQVGKHIFQGSHSVIALFMLFLKYPEY